MNINLNSDCRIVHCCPHCKKSYYEVSYCTKTCLGWSPVYKDGVLMNSDPNTITVHCRCLNCGESFTFEE